MFNINNDETPPLDTTGRNVLFIINIWALNGKDENFIFLCLEKHQQLKNTNSFVDESSTEKSQALHLLSCSVSQT